MLYDNINIRFAVKILFIEKNLPCINELSIDKPKFILFSFPSHIVKMYFGFLVTLCAKQGEPQPTGECDVSAVDQTNNALCMASDRILLVMCILYHPPRCQAKAMYY